MNDWQEDDRRKTESAVDEAQKEIVTANRTRNDDTDAGISDAEKGRRRKILEDYNRAKEEAERDTKLDSPVKVTVIGVRNIIGRGHHSNVYEARLAGSRSPVALKVDYRNLMEEYPHVWEKVKALRKIDNPHIQRLIEFVPDWTRNRSYMVYDYVPGETLQKTLYDRTSVEGGKPFPQDRVLNWGIQLLDAVRHLHDNRLLHGDINLSNIMLRPKRGKAESDKEEHDICLIDFNWGAPDLEAGEVCQDIRSDDSPPQGSMLAKPQNKEEFRRGIQRDIYHVGAVMYQLLTGEVPDTDKGREALVREEKSTGEAEKRNTLKTNSVTDDVAEVILKAISVNPEDRYSSAQKMLNALTELPLKNSDTDRAVKHFHRKLQIAGVCAVVGAFLFGLGIWQSFRLKDMRADAANAVTAQSDGDYTKALRLVRQSAGGGLFDPPAPEEAREALSDVLGLNQIDGYRTWGSLPLEGRYPVRVRLSRDESWLVVLAKKDTADMETSCIVAKSMAGGDVKVLTAVSGLDDFAFTNNHTILYADGNHLVCYELNFGKQEWVLEPPTGTDGPVAVAVSGDMTKMAVMYPDSGQVYFYNTNQPTSHAEPLYTVTLDTTPQDLPGRMFLLDKEGDLLAVSLSGAEVGVYDILIDPEDSSRHIPEAVNNLELHETDNSYTRYEGGFFNSSFLLAASTIDGTQGEYDRFNLDMLRSNESPIYSTMPRSVNYTSYVPIHIRTDDDGMFLSVGRDYYHVSEDDPDWGELDDMTQDVLLMEHVANGSGGRLLLATEGNVSVQDVCVLENLQDGDDSESAKLASVDVVEGSKPFDLGAISTEWLILTGTNRQMLSILRWMPDETASETDSSLKVLREGAEKRWNDLLKWDGRIEE